VGSTKEKVPDKSIFSYSYNGGGRRDENSLKEAYLPELLNNDVDIKEGAASSERTFDLIECCKMKWNEPLH